MRLTKQAKTDLAGAAAKRAYLTVVEAKDRAKKKIGDEIYDKVVEVAGIADLLRTAPRWALDTMNGFRWAGAAGYGWTATEMSDYKPWTGGNFYFHADHEAYIATDFLRKRYTQAAEEHATAQQTMVKFAEDMERTLDTINTVKQLQQRIPRLYELYVQLGGGEDTKNLPMVQYTNLDQKLVMLLDKDAA